MKLPSWSGSVLHAIGGAAITAAGLLVGVPGMICLITISWCGWLREVIQHDLKLTLHQWIEALAWGVGSAAVWILVEVL